MPVVPDVDELSVGARELVLVLSVPFDLSGTVPPSTVPHDWFLVSVVAIAVDSHVEAEHVPVDTAGCEEVDVEDGPVHVGDAPLVPDGDELDGRVAGGYVQVPHQTFVTRSRHHPVCARRVRRPLDVCDDGAVVGKEAWGGPWIVEVYDEESLPGSKTDISATARGEWVDVTTN